MKKRLLLILPFLILLCAFTSTNNEPKVFVIGDSISMQYGSYLKKSLQGFFNYDRIKGNGQDSKNVRKQLKLMEQNPNFKTDYLLINCGLHDIKHSTKTKTNQVSISDYKDNIKAIVASAKKLKTKLIWVTTTPVIDSIHNSKSNGFLRHTKNVDAYNKVALEIMHRHNIPVIDLHTYTQKFDASIFVDHVHFNHEIREKQADFIAGALIQINTYSK